VRFENKKINILSRYEKRSSLQNVANLSVVGLAPVEIKRISPILLQ
jgi:hypothetical protein